jgi:uncharacterized protein (TIGR04255 family)
MSSKNRLDYPALARPPIVEVVCGIVFAPIPDLDPLVLGVYWDRRTSTFPKRALQPALTDEVGFSLIPFPMRAVLSSADDQFLVQLQHDRFFMNWRAVGIEYPRFSERHGERGLLRRAAEEYESFAEFVAERTGSPPVVLRVEMTKVDMLRRGEHWSDLADLAALVPVTSVFSAVQQSDEREVNLRFVERGAEGVALVHIATLMEGVQPAAIRVEARRVAPVDGDVSATFVTCNAVLNDVFFKLIPDAKNRFGTKEGA